MRKPAIVDAMGAQIELTPVSAPCGRCGGTSPTYLVSYPSGTYGPVCRPCYCEVASIAHIAKKLARY